MKARKALIWTCILVAGFPLGYFGRGFIQHPLDRAQSALDIFAAYCVPFAHGQFLAPTEPMVALDRLGELTWADPKSAMLLEYSSRTCSVSDVLLPLNRSERERLDARVASFIERELTDLYPDHIAKLDSWAAFVVWESHPRGDDRRRGAVYSRVSSDADSETTLNFSYPINGDVSENLRELRRNSQSNEL